MNSNTGLSVSSLDFDAIRLSLRNFLANKPDFADYDFDSSAIGTLLDVLAYNTYMNSIYANMAAAESFLDTAQIRDSVVSHAKTIGYLPRSARGPSANVFIRFTSALANSTFSTISIPKNTAFSATVNGVSFKFVTPRGYLVEANSSNLFGRYLEIVEGEPGTHRYLFSTSNTEMVLPNKNADIRSVGVQVTLGGNTATYLQASDLRNINSSSKVFWVEPDRGSLYKISFGDGVIGKKPAYGSTVAVSYRVCSATRANGANNFTASGVIGGQSAYTLRCAERAAGGVEEETIESIKFNATKAYSIQGRAVTSGDYEQIILRDNSDIEDCRVWGGEDNDPPIYGKAFICLKPVSGPTISSARQTEIRADLRGLNMLSTDVEFVDPSYTYIMPTISARYEPRETTRSASEIAALIATAVTSYEDSLLNSFEGKFRYSRFLDFLDSSEDSLLTSSAIIDLQKRIVPNTGSPNTYTLRFNCSLEARNRVLLGLGNLTSSSFVYAGATCYLDDDGSGVVRIYYKTNLDGTSTRVYLNLTAGTIDYDAGTVVLDGFAPTSYEDYIKVVVRPAEGDVEPVRNSILLMSDVVITVIDDLTGRSGARIESVATIGESAFFETSDTGIASITSF